MVRIQYDQPVDDAARIPYTHNYNKRKVYVSRASTYTPHTRCTSVFNWWAAQLLNGVRSADYYSSAHILLRRPRFPLTHISSVRDGGGREEYPYIILLYYTPCTTILCITTVRYIILRARLAPSQHTRWVYYSCVYYIIHTYLYVHAARVWYYVYRYNMYNIRTRICPSTLCSDIAANIKTEIAYYTKQYNVYLRIPIVYIRTIQCTHAFVIRLCTSKT